MPSLAFWRHRTGLRTVLRGALRYLFGRRGQRRVAGLRLYYRLRMMVILHAGRPVRKFAGLAEVRLWVDGSQAFRRLEKLIRRARHTIIIQMFIWHDDETGRRIAQALVSAADRGVQVDIAKEAIGDVFEGAGDFLGTRDASHDCWRRFWSHPHIHVTYGSNRDHAKVYIIDGEILLLTGMNIGDGYRYVFHDYMAELHGSRFVEQYLTGRTTQRSNASVTLVMNTENQSRIRPALMRLLSEARESVVVEHCYLSDTQVLDALIGLAKKGLRVTVIVPEHNNIHHYANASAIGRLLAEGDRRTMRVLAYRRLMHAKIIMIDHQVAFLGSANLMRSSLDEMGEVNVVIRGRYRAMWKLRETLRRDILRSRPLSGPPSLLWLTKWLAWLGL